jgi:TOBE domain
MRIAKQAAEEQTRLRPATVVQSTFLGNCVHIEARLAGGQTVVAEVSRLTEPFATGDSVYVSWEPSDELAFE